jgi:hypothetical protein
MCATQLVGTVGNWRYFIEERDGSGLFAVVRRDVPGDRLEDPIAFAYSREDAEVIAAAVVAHRRRKNWANEEILRRNFASEDEPGQ